MNQEELGNKMGRIIARCWADAEFKQKLLADPAGTLAAEGVALPAGLVVKAVENTDSLFHLVIPSVPAELSDEELDKIAAGAWWDTLLEVAKTALPIAAQIENAL